MTQTGQRGDSSRLPRAATIADIYSRAVNTGRPAREIIAGYYPWCEPHADAIMRLLKDFTGRKRARRAARLRRPAAELARPAGGAGGAASGWSSRWDHVLVDEYQDVNQIQVDIVGAASARRAEG